jgi:DNA-binding SARP family transcriptional activator
LRVSDLKLFLLGSPRVEQAGAQINVDTRKAIALLAYLAMTGQRHSRDALAALLWPEYDHPSARGALRRTLSTLKKALGGVGLNADRETVGLDSGTALWLDVEQFQRLLAAGRTNASWSSTECASASAPLIEAVALYGDHFMAGFSLRDSPDFDDWQFFQAESLRRDLATALERLIHCHTLLGESEPAIGYARRWLALDPLHEPAHRQLMLLYAWAGQRAAALHQYSECVRVLDQELGVLPLEETTQLYQAIKEKQTPPPPTIDHQPPPADSHMRSTAPFVPAGESAGQPLTTHSPHSPAPLIGRAAEWSILLRSYASIDSDGRLIVLEGEAGIGKTRLAEELLTYAETSGATTITARCYEGETNMAYGPFLDGLRAALHRSDRGDWLSQLPARWLSETARLLPELESLHPDLPPLPALDTPGAQSRFFEGIIQVFIAACGGTKPGILFLDDLHWADAASLNLLAYLVRRLRGQPLCLLVTWRRESVPSSHRARAILAEAQRAGLATSLSLGRLSHDAVIELVCSSTIASVPYLERLGERLYTETEGLPFFIVEYLAALVQHNQSLAGDEWSVPTGVRDLLHSRLAGLSEIGWQVLTTAAVIGRSFDYDSVREASGRSEEEAVEALEQLIGLGLVQEIRSNVAESARRPTYDFCHEKLRVLVYEETSLARRRLLHRRVAEALISRARGQIEQGTLAGIVAQH